jgi:hypothetical protein
MIGAMKQVEAGRKVKDVAARSSCRVRTVFSNNPDDEELRVIEILRQLSKLSTKVPDDSAVIDRMGNRDLISRPKLRQGQGECFVLPKGTVGRGCSKIHLSAATFSLFIL